MKWSKLKFLAESFLTESLKGRVQYYRTSYGKHDSTSMSRAWVIFDGEEVLSFSEIDVMRQQFYRTNQILASKCSEKEPGFSYHEASRLAQKQLMDEGIFSQEMFVASLRKYINLAIEDAISSENHLIRALSLFDRRLGRRRFSTIQIDDQTPNVVREFFRIRKSVE